MAGIQNRRVDADLVRVVACCSVISVHFFLYTGFYNEPLESVEKLLFLLIRNCSMVCVPLFIMLTGFLMNKKQASTVYYTKGLKTVGTYLLCSLVCIIYKLATGFEYDTVNSFLKILTFNAAPYGWYMEMYFGLYLLIPLLNGGFWGLKEKKWQKAAVISLLSITALPSILNVYNFTEPSFWTLPTVTAAYQQIVPKWWAGIYPITYYFMGAYIAANPVKIKRRYLLIGFFAVLLLFTGYCEWRSRGGNFVWGAWNDWGSPFITALAFFAFLLLSDIDQDKTHHVLCKLLAFISDHTLSAYLLSFIFDERMYYKYLNITYPTVFDRLPHYFYCVPIIFICSLFSAVLVDYLYLFLLKGGNLIFDLVFSKKAAEN